MKKISLLKDFILFLFFASFLSGCHCTKPFSFVQLTDPQLGFGGYEHDIAAFEEAIKQINELIPDFVVICGDMVNVPNDSSFTDFSKLKAKLNMPCFCVPGNHDIGNSPDKRSISYYREVMGKDYYSFKHKGFLFIFANTQLWKSEVQRESAIFDRWFAKTIKSGNIKHPSFVIGHYPLYLSEPGEKSEYFNIDPGKRKEILDLFTKNNVVAYLSGHAHKIIDNNYQNIQLISGETTSKNFDKRPLGMRLWIVSNDSVSHQFIPLNDKIDENKK